MFRALLCPSSGTHDYNVDYHIGRLVGWSSVRGCRLKPAIVCSPTPLQPNRT